METWKKYSEIIFTTNKLCERIIIIEILLNQEEKEEKREKKEEREVRDYRKRVIIEEIKKKMIETIEELEYVVYIRENIYKVELKKKEREEVIEIIEEIYKRLGAIEKWLVEKINIMIEKEILYRRMKLNKL